MMCNGKEKMCLLGIALVSILKSVLVVCLIISITRNFIKCSICLLHIPIVLFLCSHNFLLIRGLERKFLRLWHICCALESIMLFTLALAALLIREYVRQQIYLPLAPELYTVCCLIGVLINAFCVELTDWIWRLYNVGGENNFFIGHGRTELMTEQQPQGYGNEQLGACQQLSMGKNSNSYRLSSPFTLIVLSTIIIGQLLVA